MKINYYLKGNHFFKSNKLNFFKKLERFESARNLLYNV